MYNIPTGENKEDKKARELIIREFFRSWKTNHPESFIYNKQQRQNINIRNVSLIEACEHTAKTYASTKALFNIDSILTEAKKVGTSLAKKNNRNQKPFNKMMLMEYYSEETGKIKITVGINRRTLELILYCITKV